MKLVIAGGSGSLGQRAPGDFGESGDEVVILTVPSATPTLTTGKSYEMAGASGTGQPTLGGVIHVTAPSPIQNRDMMADAARALTGRRCAPRRLVDAGFTFGFGIFGEAIADLTGRLA
jgi:NAD dependent epimerase/dehydratase family enzyme